MASNSKTTTLFNLKDEYLAAKQAPRAASSSSTHKKLRDIIHYRPRDVSRQGKQRAARELARAARERARAARLALTAQEEEALARSSRVLEAKAAVYDKLLKHRGESSENILVDFSQKRVEEEEETPSVEISYDYSSTPGPRIDPGLDPLPDLGPTEVHLSNVDGGEVRTKGVGFYAFSVDAETRKQQLEFLSSMRESTERSRELYRAARAGRRQDKLDRLNRLRKRLEMAPITRLPGEKEVPVEEAVVGEGLEAPDLARSIEERFLLRERSMWERRVEELRGDREAEFAPHYGGEGEEEELGEEDEAIVNFISFVRHSTS